MKRQLIDRNDTIRAVNDYIVTLTDALVQMSQNTTDYHRVELMINVAATVRKKVIEEMPIILVKEFEDEED